jgi:hypothetical protein
MSVFLTPELQPVYAGTYFPKENAYGRPGFKTLLGFLSRSWNENREALMTDSRKVVDAVRQIHGGGDQGDLVPRTAVTEAAEQIWRAYDREQGGLASGSNKFPPSLSMDLLLREYLHSGYEPYRNAVELTLERMGNGGIYDHLGGGLCRYSTDTKWLVPHFEKMLYDQGLVASIYVDAWQATEREELKQLFSDRARGICDYVLRDLRSPDGAFYSSEDADSEGLEGKFYIWTLDEVKRLLGEDAGRIFASHYDVSEFGNWGHAGDDHVPHGPKNILQVARSAGTIAKLNNLDVAEVAKTIEESRRKLFEARERRTRPGLDDKILCGWNGLMTTALAKAAAVLAEPRYGAAAAQAAQFVLGAMRQEGRLLASYGKGQARLKAYSTDYAFFIEGLLALFESSGDLRWLTAAGELADTMIEHYWDAAGGGFYFTAADHEELLVRSKTANDGAIPSGNSVMLMNLQKLAILLDRGDLREKAEKIIRSFGSSVPRTPFQHERLLCGIEAWHQGFEEIAIVGAADDPATRALVKAVYGLYLPNKVIARVDLSDEKASKGLPLLAGKTLIDGKPAAYVCRNYSCQKPVTQAEDLRSQLLNAAKASA